MHFLTNISKKEGKKYKITNVIGIFYMERFGKKWYIGEKIGLKLDEQTIIIGRIGKLYVFNKN